MRSRRPQIRCEVIDDEAVDEAQCPTPATHVARWIDRWEGRSRVRVCEWHAGRASEVVYEPVRVYRFRSLR